MPYIVTTTRPCTCDHDGSDGRNDVINCAVHGPLVLEVTRRALATLDEARREADTILTPWALAIPPDAFDVLAAACKAIPESGGSVELPDGTVIEVTATTVSDLADTLSMDAFNRLNYEGAGEADWIAAYNEKQASHA